MTKVMIDPGHGGADPGAVASGFSAREKDLTLAIARHIDWYLNNYFVVDTKLTREIDKTLNLAARTRMANAWGADYFISVHVNAGGGTGYEDFILVGLSDSGTTARYRDAVHSEIAAVIKKYGVRDRGKKKANLYVIRNTKCPAALTESLFIDRTEDQKLLANPEFIKDMAIAHAKGIAKALNLKSKNRPAPTPQPEKPNLEAKVGLKRVVVDGKAVGAWETQSYLLRNVEKALESGAKEVLVQDATSAEKSSVRVNLKGRVVSLDGFLDNETNYVSIRQLLEALGLEVSWDGENRIVMVK